MSEGSQSPHTEAQHRYGAAKGYSQTIKMIVLGPHYQTEARSFSVLPTHLLLGFALELYFKAWLLQAGLAPTRVEAFRHKLSELLAAATDEGLPEIPRLNEVVGIINRPHRHNTYRYMGGGEEIEAMNWPLVFPILDALDEVVDRRVGASAAHNLTPDR